MLQIKYQHCRIIEEHIINELTKITFRFLKPRKKTLCKISDIIRMEH